MSRNNRIATDIIDSRIIALTSSGYSDSLHAEASMAIEISYALGAIDCGEHTHYTARLKRIFDREIADTTARISGIKNDHHV